MSCSVPHRMKAAGVLLVLMALVWATPAQAQTNLGTYSVGEIYAQLHGTHTWAVDNSTPLPPGLSLRFDVLPFFQPDAHAGLIGVVTTPNTYFFNLIVDGAPVAYQLKVTSLGVKDDWRIADASVSVPYSYQLTAQDNVGSVTWALNGPASQLPPGVSFSPAGLFSGTPTGSGIYNVSFSFSDSVDTVFRSVTINVYDVRIDTNGLLPNASIGVPYDTTITASGGTGPYTFTSDSLPTGLALSSSGQISGTATSGSGPWSFYVTATDSNFASVTKRMSIDVLTSPMQQPNIAPYGNLFEDCAFGLPCIRPVYVSSGGRAPFTWSVSGLPPGMDTRTGSGNTQYWVAPGDLEIWGVPKQLGTFHVQVTATDADNVSATNTFDLTVRPLHVWNSMQGGTIEVPYTFTFYPLGGTLPYTATLVGGRLPNGLTLDSNTLTVSGTPHENGSFKVSFLISDSSGDPSHTLYVTHYPYFGSATATVNITSGDDLGTVTAGFSYGQTLFACCVPSYSWSIVGGTTPPGLALSPSGVLSGTIPSGTEGLFQFIVRVEDATNSANFALRQFQMYVTPLQVSSSIPSFGNVSAFFTGSASVSGATGGVTWSLEGSQGNSSYLPPGLSLTSGGVLSGTPTASGRYSFRLRVTDSVGHYALTWFTVEIYPSGTTPPLNLPSNFNFTNFSVGVFTQQLQATGGTPPYHYSITPAAPTIPGMRVQDGAPLPTSFPASVTGGLVGVLTSSGPFSTSVRVTDSLGATFDKPVNISVSPVQILSQSPLPRPTLGQPYSFTLTAYGGTAYTWTGSNLPAGLSVDSAGQITGTPTASGSFNPVFTATDLATLNAMSRGFTLVVNPFAITTGGILPTGTVGVAYNQPLAAPGCTGTCTWSATGLGASISLSSAGVLSGTPTGTLNNVVTVTVTGSNGTVQKTFALVVLSATPQPLAITTASFSDATIGNQVSNGLFASGGAPPYTWTLESGALPLGVSLQGPGDTLGANLGPGFTYLAGRPMQLGVASFTLRVTDSLSATTTRAFNWNISALSSQYGSLPLAGTTLKYNVAYTQPLLVLGGDNTYAWASAAIPPGLSLDSGTGVVSGTPSNTGNFNSTVQVTDGASNSFTSNLSFNIAGSTGTTLGFNQNANLGTFQQGQTVTTNIVPNSGTPPYVITALTPLPSWLTLIPLTGGGNPAGSQTITGYAQTAGNASFTLMATDSLGNIGVRTFTMTVAPFVLFTSGLADASVGVPYSHSLTVFGGGVTWSIPATTVMPPGITVSSAGVFSGTPTTPGTFGFTLTQTLGGASVNSNFTLRVSGIALATDPPILPTATVGIPYPPYAFTATGGGPTKVWQINGLPNGLTMSSAGVISGTPTGSGNFNLQLTINDGGVSLNRRFLLPVVNTNPNVLDIAMAGTALVDAILGQITTYTLGASGGLPPYTWSLAPGSTLPPGIVFVPGTANPTGTFPGTTLLSGTPIAAGSYSFDLIVADTGGHTARRTFSLNVSTLGIVANLANATTGVAFTGRITAVGGASPYTITKTPISLTQDMLPPGLALSADGLITGTPTSTGTYRFFAHVEDSGGHTLSRQVQLQVFSPSGAQVTSLNPNDLSVGHRVVQSPQIFSVPNPGASYNWSLVGGAFPPGVGLTFDETTIGTTGEEIVGQPTAAGTFTYTLRATNTGNPSDVADHTFTAKVSAMEIVSVPIGIVPPSELPSGHAGEFYSTTIKVANGTPPYVFGAGGLLPPGLTLSGTGVLSGTLTATGAFTVPVVITDDNGQTLNRFLTLFVTPSGVPAPLLPINDFDLIDTPSVGAPYLYRLEWLVRGGVAPITWSDPGSTLPPGLTIQAGANGVPSFLGGVATSEDFYDVSLVATDATGQSTTVTFEMGTTSLALGVPSLPSGMVGAPYSISLGPSGGVAPVSAQIYLGTDLPVGLTLSPSGVLSGTPVSAGNFLIAVLLQDGVGNFLGRLYWLTIDNAAGEAPAITIAPKPIQLYYELGSPAPDPVPLAVNVTSGIAAFTLNLTGAPWATLSFGNGVAPTSVNLNVDPTGLGAGTYSGFLGITAPDAVNRVDIAPVVLTVAPPPPCTYAVNPTSGTLPSAGGSSGFDVATGSSCSWAATPSDPWITITSAGSGTGIGSVSFSAAPNASASARVGTITVNGAVYTLTQFGLSCSIAIAPSNVAVSAAGGAGAISVIASDASCTWNASGLGASPASGVGNGTVTFNVPPNPDPASRTLNATIGGNLLTVDQTGAACTAALDASAASFGSGGGTGSVVVTTPSGCGYSTVLGPSWISVTSGASNPASGGTLVFDVSPNTATFPRSGSLSIGGQLFSVSQEALACSITVDTSLLGSPFGAPGGPGSIGITANGSNCSWTASSDQSWASIAPHSGSGNGTVFVTAASNGLSPTPRLANLTVGGQTIGLTQNGIVCTYNLQSLTASVPGTGGAGGVGVVAATACTWNSVSNDPTWLTITSSGSAGSGDVQFVAQPNPTPAPRIGHLSIAGLSYTVNQAAAPCTYTLSSTGTTVAESGASDSFTYSSSGGCSPPEVRGFASWLHVTASPGTVNFTVDANPFGLSRIGVIQVADQVFRVTQLGAACAFSLNNYGAYFTHLGGSGTVLGSPSGVGCTPTVGTDQPTIIHLGTLIGPISNIFTQPYDVMELPPPITPFIRRMTITFGGQLFVVKQTSW